MNIFGKWIKYNANSRGAYAGDCVKRALSVVYSLPYDEVSKELNRIKRAGGASAYNDYWVFTRFLSDRGDKLKGVSDNVTLEEFADSHPQGVYFVETGKSNGRISDHVVAVVNGDIYDSWDSRKEKVYKAALIQSGKSDVYELDLDYVFTTVNAFAANYVEQLDKKNPEYLHVEYKEYGEGQQWDSYTEEIRILAVTGDVPKRSAYRANNRFRHDITVKANPRLSAEENIAILQKKLKQQIYDWLYNIKKEMKDAEAAATLEIHPQFRDRIIDLMKAPEWARPLITEFEDNGNSDYGFRFVVYMEALPGDPRINESSDVRFEADTLTELKHQFQYYKEDFSRVNYDY